MGACLLGVPLGLGGVPAAAQQAGATDHVLVAADGCPVTWPALGSGPSGDRFDGHVSVLVGGNLTIAGGAAGAEGTVVAHGDATFVRADPGSYQVGVIATGSQVSPHPDSDMLVVGGDLTGDPATPLEVGGGLGADVVVGGEVAAGTSVDLGGTLDEQVPSATAPYDALVKDLPAKSAAYADRPVTGIVEVTEAAITLTGDGASDPQVFSVEGASLGATEGGPGRHLQVLGVPDGAAVVVNLTGPAVDLDVESLLGPGGKTVDPFADGIFADLATHLLWNVPTATTVDLGGAAQLPGSLLVASSSSITTLSGAGTNGRVLVAGDLVHTGAGGLHSYPFLRDPDLTCGPDLKHLGVLTLDVKLTDPGAVVDPQRFFQGTFACFLDGADVTPGEGTWQLRAEADERLLSDGVPVGAQCFVDEQLEVAPAPGWDWATPEIAPSRVTVAKRDPRGVTITNSVQQIKTPPTPLEEDLPATPDTTSDPTTAPVVPEQTPADPTGLPPIVPDPDASSPTTGPTGLPDGALPSQPPVSVPVPPVPGDEDADADAEAGADSPSTSRGPGPLTTTAPYTLRGAFVWGPMLLLSLLVFRLRFPRTSPGSSTRKSFRKSSRKSSRKSQWRRPLH